MPGREKNGTRWPACVLMSWALGGALSLQAAPIKSILVHQVGDGLTPLGYVYDQDTDEGVLVVNIESFTAVVTREPDDETEFIANASFNMFVTGLTDLSSPPWALGSFQFVEFQLWDGIGEGAELLLHGRQIVDAQFIYAETPVRDIMSMLSDPVEIIGGVLAPEFGEQATLFGMGLMIDPSTDDIDQLNINHTGSIMLKLLPIPEPGSVLFWVLASAWAGRRRAEGY